MFVTVIILKSARTSVKNQLSQLMEDIGKAKDKTHFMRVIDEIVTLSEKYDDDALDTLCYIITLTDDWDVRSHALTVIYKITGR